MFVSYFILLPAGVKTLQIGHNSCKQTKNVVCKIKVFNSQGKELAAQDSKETYPLKMSFENERLDQDQYLHLQILRSDGTWMPGTLDILYGSLDHCYGIETAGLTDFFNAASKPSIKSQVLKNNIVISRKLANKVFVLNANPTLSAKTSRSGTMRWSMLDNQGKRAVDGQCTLPAGELKIIDLGEELLKSEKVYDEPRFYSFVADADVNIFPITFNYYDDQVTGCEHSQPPFAYYKGSEGGPQKRQINVLRALPYLIKGFLTGNQASLRTW